MLHGKTSTQIIFKLIFVFSLFVIPLKGIAQYDYEHYVPPFYCSFQVGKQEVFLSTNSEKNLNVYIEDGQGNLVAGPFTINRTQSKTYIFETPLGATYSYHNTTNYPDGSDYSRGIVGPKELNKPIDGHGLRIYSYDGPFFANIRHGFSNDGESGALTHGGSLSAKGAYAKGKEFYSGHLYGHTILAGDPLSSGGRPVRSHFISVMAVEDGETTVSFSGIKCKYITKYDENTKKVFLEPIMPDETITVNLTKGQSYVVGVNLHEDQFKSESLMVRNGMNGTHITSNKEIVVNSGSWTAGAIPSQDIGFDQIVPVDQVRDKYIVMKGQGKYETLSRPNYWPYNAKDQSNYAGQERTIVVATQANTQVWVNGSNKGTLASPGDFMILDDIVNPAPIPTLYIDTKGKNVYVYQTMCGTDLYWTNIGLNFIPPLTALGMKEVVIPRANYITTGSEINPTVTVLAQKNVTVKYNETSLNNPQDVPGTTEWVYYEVPNITGDCRFIGNKAINVAWTAHSNTLGAAGYYSGFTKAVSPIIPDLGINADIGLICESYDENIQVSVKEPLPDFYEWYVDEIAGSPFIENAPLIVPAPNKETNYHVLGYYRDPNFDILFNGDFSDGFNGFESDYELVDGSLTDPGQFAITFRPIFENPSFEDFGAMDGGALLLAYSKNQGDVIYQVNEVPVDEKSNYILKLHGRLAKQPDGTNFFNQSLKVTINDETIIENFKIDNVNEPWQSAAALWKPGTAQKATIKVINNNSSGEKAVFALDSITFVQAVEDQATFVARVVPNFSYDSNGGQAHFCLGTSNFIDISNGDTSWYEFAWFKKDGENYIELSDGLEFSGTATPKLTFENPQKKHEATYRCTIKFKPEYVDCGVSESSVNVDVVVNVDEAATVKIEADRTDFCFETNANLTAQVTGDAGGVKWFVNGATTPVSVETVFAFNGYPAGTYQVRCEAENGCGLAFDEITLNVYSAPNLAGLSSNDNLCEGQDIILTAQASGSGTLKYTWKRGSEVLAEQGNVLNYTATMDDRNSIFSVQVSSIYNLSDQTLECPNSLNLAVVNLDIQPLIQFEKGLSPATICEGQGHNFDVELKYPGDYNTYEWYKDDGDLGNALSSYILSDAKSTDAGKYKVQVTNQCDTKTSEADLTVLPKLEVTSIDIDQTGPFCTPTNLTVTFTDNGSGAIYTVKRPNGTEETITNPYTFEINATNQGRWTFTVNGNCVSEPISEEFSLNMIPDFGSLSVADAGTCVGEDVSLEAKIDNIPALSVLTYAWTDNNGNPVGGDSETLSIANVQDANLGTYTVTVTDQCGRSKTASANLSKEEVTTPVTAANIEKCAGDNFRIDLSYFGNPDFEWRFNDPNGTVISTNDYLEIASVTTADAGIYYCNVNLVCGKSVVIQRELVVYEHISITNPADETIHICEGEKPQLTIDVNGNADEYTIEWLNTSSTVLGTGNQILLPAHNTPGNFAYKAKISGKCENPEKNYTVIVHEKPVLATLNNSPEECSGLVSLTITENGEHNAITWWKDGSKITDGNAEDTNFIINPATSPDDDGIYIAKTTSDYCGDAQVSIDLDVRNSIVVTDRSPIAIVKCENDPTSLYVTATGDDIQYKWYKSSDPATELSNTRILDLGAIQKSQEGEYKCELSNDLNCGNQTLIFTVQVKEDATVSNPVSIIMCETDPDPVFTVTATGEAPLSYQWYDKEDNPVAGATSSSLTVTNPVDGQSYYCIVSGSSCKDATSDKATLTVIKNVRVTDPVDLIIADGENATFSVIASGEPNYTYQWQVRNGATWDNLADAGKYSGTQTAKLQITAADKAGFDGKQYRCIVQSTGVVCASTATSNPATLTVTDVAKIAVQASDAIVCFNDNAVLSVEGTRVGLTYTWYYKKGAGAYETANGKDGMSASVTGKTATLTIPATDMDINNWKFKCLVSDGISTDQYSSEVSVQVLEDIAVTTADANFERCVNDAFSLSVSATGDGIQYKWYKVGDETTTLSTSSIYNLGNLKLTQAGIYKCEIYNAQGCNDQVRSFGISIKEHATVSDPVDVVMCASDSNPVFTVTATGEAPLSYQWYDKDNNPVTGATSNTLTITSPVTGQSYYCIVSGDACDDASSERATLTVLPEVSVSDPVDVTIADGGTATFSVVASGTPDYAYQWQVKNGASWDDLSDGGTYSGVQSATLTITGADLSYDGKQYRCIVNSSRCSGIAESNLAILSVNNVIKIAAQPSDDEVCESNSASLSIKGTAVVTTYTWKYRKNPADPFIDAAGQDGMSENTVGLVSTLTIPNASLVMNFWEFKCVVSDGTSTDDESNIVQLSVVENIVVTTADANFEPCSNDVFVLSVNASGGNPKYKWYESTTPGTILSHSSTYDFGNIKISDAGQYKCEVYNDLGCGGKTVVFDVNVKQHATVSDPVDVVMCASDPNPEFTVTATGEAPLSYQWYDKNDNPVPGATTNKLTVTTPVHGETYYCIVSGTACNNAKSAVAKLTVYEEVAIVKQPIDNFIPDGGTALFTVTVTGEPDYNYQWQVKNGAAWDDLTDAGKYSGTTTASLRITGADKVSFDGKQYRCIVGNTECPAQATSNIALLSITSVVKIAGQPQNLQACLGDAAEFEITGTTTGLTYIWEYSTDAVNYNPIAGVAGLSATTSTSGSSLKIDAASLAMNTWKFRCVVSDLLSADQTSNPVGITVIEPVGFDNITNQNLCFGVGKQISINNLSGTAPVNFSWVKDGSEISTTSNVSIAGTDNGNYQLTVSNGGICPDKVSNFTVAHYSELQLAAWSNTNQLCIGDPNESLAVAITKDPALTATYTWYKDDSPVGNGATFDLLPIDKDQSGLYKLEVSDGCSTEAVSGDIVINEPLTTLNSWDATQNLCVGDELKLDVQVSGDILSYVWTKDGAPLTPGLTLLISEVAVTDAGQYKCVVTGKCGNVFQYVQDVSILKVPEITNGIDALSAVCEGEELKLGPVGILGTYDGITWLLNDNSVNATAGTTLDLGFADLSEEGNYKVTVNNVCGTDVSIGKQIVNPIPSLDPIASQVACQGDYVVFRANAVGRNLTYQWLVDGVDQLVATPELILDGSKVQPLDANTPKTYSIECRIVSPDACGNASETTSLTVNPNTILQTTLANVTRYVGENYTMTLDITGANLVYEWTHEANGIKTPLPAVTGPSINFTNITMADAGYYNCRITGACGQRLASGKLTIKEPVNIVEGLNDFEKKCVGEPLTLALNVTGQVTSVKWYKDNVLLPTTDLNFFISKLALEDAGVYTCKIEGEGISVIEESVTVRVYPLTKLNAPLQDMTLCEGASLDWIPDVSGASDLQYRWMLNGTEVFDQRILHYDALTLNQEGNYEVQATGLCGTVSTSANLEIIQLPVFVKASSNREVCENTALVEFSVEYNGENLQYQWRKDGNSIPGKTIPTLSLTSIQLEDAGSYDCRVYSSCGEAISPKIELSVIPQLKILSNPVDVEVCEGEEVLFATQVQGNDVKYQWKVNGTELSGEVASSLQIAKSEVADNGYYTCIVSDNCTDYRSTKPTELLVNALPNTSIFGRMRLCAKEDRVTYTTIDQPDIEYGWGVQGGIFAGPEEGLRTRITWQEATEGALSVQITDLRTGCQAPVDSLVTLHPLPTVNLNAYDSKGICEEAFALSGGYPEGGIYWVNGISEKQFIPSERGPGEYNVHYSYTDENGCSNISQTTSLKVDALPVVDIIDDITVGSCKPTQLEAKTRENNIKWTPVDNLDDPNSKTPVFTPGESQVLVASVQDEHGCVGVDLVNLTVAPLPVVTTIPDVTVGQCNQLELTTDIVGDMDKITWTNPGHLDDPNVRSPKIVNAPEGTHTYQISVTDLYGCDAKGEVTVTMVADPKLPEDRFGCEGVDQFEVDITAMKNPEWDNPEWNSPEAPKQRVLKEPGEYILTVGNEYACGDEQRFVINPKHDLGLKDTLIFEGQSVTFAPNLPLEYAPYFFEWQDGSILQRLEVTKEGMYKLKVEDNLGCIAKDSSYVTVKPIGIESPTAFTPEANNENNKFYLKEINVVETFEMYVYDRWGELLYKTKEVGYNGGWDGTYKGKLCPAGAYVWIAFVNGELTNKGTIVLVR